MSFDQLSNIESGRGGSTTASSGRHQAYSDNPEFTSLSKSLMTSLFHLQGNNAKLKTEIDRLGTRQDNPRLRERVQTLLDESTEQFKSVGEGVKKLQTQWGGDDVTPTQKWNQQKLAREFGAGLKEFQGLQRTAVHKLNASVSAARAALEQEAASGTGEQRRDPGEQGLLQRQQEQIHLAAQDDVDFQDALIVEREEEIRHIEEGVNDLNVLFRQVAQIVSEQGEQLETIESTAINVRDDTRAADIELRSAARYQKNARSKACCLLLIMAVILTIVILAVFLG